VVAVPLTVTEIGAEAHLQTPKGIKITLNTDNYD